MTILATGCASWSSHSKEARSRADKAAATLVAINHSDTLALEQSILDAKAIQSEYALMGDSDAVRAFDESFKEYVKKHDANLARQIFENN